MEHAALWLVVALYVAVGVGTMVACQVARVELGGLTTKHFALAFFFWPALWAGVGFLVLAFGANIMERQRDAR